MGEIVSEAAPRCDVLWSWRKGGVLTCVWASASGPHRG
jgi:hypothetical protein